MMLPSTDFFFCNSMYLERKKIPVAVLHQGPQKNIKNTYEMNIQTSLKMYRNFFENLVFNREKILLTVRDIYCIYKDTYLISILPTKIK